jgi:hypothetical protein
MRESWKRSSCVTRHAGLSATPHCDINVIRALQLCPWVDSRDDVDRNIVLPWLTDDEIGDLKRSAFEFACRGVDQAVLLALAIDGLTVDHDHADFTWFESAAGLESSQQDDVVGFLQQWLVSSYSEKVR